ncbi:hypothetical protein H5410_037111 [Solanum commersonii]|uniref:Uncharacterized protein n=1 Tax=Solanum commersonii TaxID=4109 RepID=A0A9J5Y7J7_SOLCO|nr:hypothetical protein H5410_037111 [Solanum commersonii]
MVKIINGVRKIPWSVTIEVHSIHGNQQSYHSESKYDCITEHEVPSRGRRTMILDKSNTPKHNKQNQIRLYKNKKIHKLRLYDAKEGFGDSI